MKRLPVPFEELKTIHHCADIHIRNLKRHREYREVFARLYEKLKEDTENAIIVVGGDVAHAKTEMSPELIDLASDFFINLASIMPTIVVTGNHDTNLNNVHRLDALSPIIKNLNLPNLFYLKRSGVYQIADVSLSVMSIFDDPDLYLRSDKVDGETKIALYHGTVDKSISDTGYSLTNERVKANIFNGYDITLLGDIHKRQYLNSGNTIAYPGSLIQQNHGEDLEKGYLKWDVKKRISTFIQIPNEYGYYTLYIDKGILPAAIDIPERSRLRLRVSNTDPNQVQNIMVEIRRKYPKLEEIVVNRIDPFIRKDAQSNKIDIGDVSDPMYQFKLICDYLGEHFFVDEKTLQEIQKINEELNEKLPTAEVVRNVIWKPKQFTFSNMFSYGEGNVIDFSKMKGVVGLFAPNATGKSAILDSVLFTLFDKCSRAFKGSHVMNNKKKRFNAKLKFEVNGKDFYIERHAARNDKGDVNIKVDFYQLDDSNVRQYLNADQRKTTNKIVREYVGTYEDFVLTAMSTQKQTEGSSFIDMRQSERKDLLAQFLDLGVFDNLFELANNESKDISSVLKDYQKRNFPKELATAEFSLRHKEKDYEKKNTEKAVFDKEEKELSEKKLSLVKQLIEVVQLSADIETLKVRQASIAENIQFIKDNIKTTKQNLSATDELVIEQKKYMIQNFVGIENQFQEYKDLIQQKEVMEREVDKIKIEIRNKLEKLDKLKDLQYDPKCWFCMNNIFVKDAIQTKEGIEHDRLKTQELLESLKSREIEIDEKSFIKDRYTEYQSKLREIQELERGKSNIEYNLLNLEKDLDTKKSNHEKVSAEIRQYYKNEKAIIHNTKIQLDIENTETRLQVVTDSIEKLENEIRLLHGEIEVLKNRIDTINKEMLRERELEEKLVAYNYYIQSIQRDGIPTELIKKTLPVIESEINNILGQMVDFQIILDFEGKNINSSIVYDEYNVWPIELVSGMERFISSIAIRVALLNVSSLPRPNFLAIDEGFSALDGDNVNNLSLLFDYLKASFDFILVISHIDSMRDMVDTIMEIKKKGEYSTVKFE